MEYYYGMKTKPLTFLLALTFLFLFSGSSVVFADDLQDRLDAATRGGETVYKLELLMPLAEKGDPRAQNLLGDMYDMAWGVPQNYKKAVKWYRLSAEMGLHHAQHSLGWMYKKGHGVLQDYKLAHMWWNIAGSGGYVDALNERKHLEKEMTPSQIEKAQEMARNWRPKFLKPKK
jgi:hypothetical protein